MVYNYGLGKSYTHTFYVKKWPNGLQVNEVKSVYLQHQWWLNYSRHQTPVNTLKKHIDVTCCCKTYISRQVYQYNLCNILIHVLWYV